MNKLFILISFWISTLSGFANLDSLKIKLDKAKTDSARIEILYRASLSSKYSTTVHDSLLQVISSYKKSNNCFVRFYSVYKVGQNYIENDEPKKALPVILNSLAIADSCHSKRGIMYARNKLAYINKVIENFRTAKYNAHYSLAYALELKDSNTIWNNYTLLGNMYKTEMKLDSALYYHQKALVIKEIQKDKKNLALTYNNLGLVYKNLKEFDKALLYLRKSLAVKREIKDKSIYAAYNNMSIVFKNSGKFDSALYYSKLVVEEGLKRKSGPALTEGLVMLAEVYDKKKEIANALHYYKRLREVEDSVNKDKIDLQFQELQSKYESDKKDSDLRLKEESLKTAEAMNSRKNIMITLSVIALLMAIVASVFIYRSYKQSKHNELMLENKNKIIEEKNKEITDSINYAKNIQQSLITSEQVFAQNLKEHFILYLPKDIVSGDFYWAQKVNEEFLIMCADCTGHGVPGAFMSLMGIGFLKEIVNQKHITRPDLILNELRERIIESFSSTNTKDGMDAALVTLSGLKLQVSAANNPIWIIRDNENIPVRPNKFPIGKHYGEQTDFTLNTIQLKEGDLILLYTDGYADQFGGPDNKKHKYKAIEKLILDNHKLPLNSIKELLHQNLVQWKGANEQVDDILVIGIRV